MEAAENYPAEKAPVQGNRSAFDGRRHLQRTKGSLRGLGAHILRTLTERLFQEVRQLLEKRKLLLKSGTIVDATIIAAPPSTENAAQSRDPEMKQVRKGKQWYFEMKVHVGTDRRGFVHSLVTGPASQGDITRRLIG